MRFYIVCIAIVSVIGVGSAYASDVEALKNAIRSNDTKKVQNILQQSPDLVRVFGVLHTLAQEDNENVIQAVFNQSQVSDISSAAQRNNKEGATPLHVAAQYNSANFVRQLYQKVGGDRFQELASVPPDYGAQNRFILLPNNGAMKQ